MIMKPQDKIRRLHVHLVDVYIVCPVLGSSEFTATCMHSQCKTGINSASSVIIQSQAYNQI